MEIIFYFLITNFIDDNDDDDILSRVLSESLNNQANDKNKNIEIDIKPRLVKHTKRCSICQEKITSGQQTIHLKCKHYFHYECINEWVKHKTSCPNCRKEIPIKNI